MSFHLIVARDFDHMSRVAAEAIRIRIARTLIERGTFVLGLAAGHSPVGVYRHLAEAFNDGRLDVSRVRSFNLDEYVGLPGEDPPSRARHPGSFASAMSRDFFGLLRGKFADARLPAGHLVEPGTLIRELQAHPGDWQEQGVGNGKAIVIRPDAESEGLRRIRSGILDAYEREIRRAGGIDLQIVGVGEHGHVAFHESGIPFDGNRMLLVKLADSTVANAVADGHFARPDDCPRYAISMGAELIYEARCVVLLASGRRKAGPVAASLAGNPTPTVPISYGQICARRGNEMIYVIDREAAPGVLARRAEIEKHGIEIEDLSGMDSAGAPAK